MYLPTRVVTSRTLLRSLAFMFLVLSGKGVAEQQRWQLAMNNAELRDITEEMSSILNTTVILDPRVQGRITVMSSQALDREGVRQLFYSVLDAHNFTVIDQGDRILITPVADARTRASQGDPQTTRDGQFVTEVIALGASTASDLAGLVRPLVSSNGYVGPSVSANALVVTDTASNVRRIGKVVRQLDSGARNAHTIVVLRHGVASEIAKVLEESLGKSETTSLVIADSRTNRLVVVGPSLARERLVNLARSLDIPATSKLDNARVIRLNHSDAKQLAEVLDALGQGFKAQADVGNARNSQLTTPIMVGADERQNALVLFAEPKQLHTLENIVRELDQPRAQVLIHAAIVEFTGDIVEALGVQWGVNRGDAGGIINFPGTGASLLDGLIFDDKGTVPQGALLRLGGGSFNALISALANNSRSNLLSTPSLLTLDNQEAEIIVGQNVPFKTGSYATNSSGADNPFTTVERKDVGIRLRIRPHINEGSNLRLEVEQEISDIAPSVSGIDSSDLITNKRALKSTVLANDGEIIVLGGLIRDSVTSQESGVPGLRSIPYLGALFRWTQDTKTKSNLMVFLRPTIVRSQRDIAQISEDRYKALRDITQPSTPHRHALTLPENPHQLFDRSDEKRTP